MHYEEGICKKDRTYTMQSSHNCHKPIALLMRGGCTAPLKMA